MSAVHAMGKVGAARRAPSNEPTMEQLEDALYDILATGVDPGAAPGALEAAQALLHAHARSRKSPAELYAFFQAYGLPVVSDRLPAGALGALPALPSTPAQHMAMQPSAAGYASPSMVGMMQAPARSQLWLWTVAAGVLIGLGAAIGLGVATITGLRDELHSVRAQAMSSAQTLQQVQSQAEVLRGDLRENAALVQRADKKSDLLVRSLLSPLDPAKLP